MPFTGSVEIRGRVYAARTVTGIAQWVAVPHGYSDGTHVDYKPRLMVEVEMLKNYHTPPVKWRVAGKIPAKGWAGRGWISAFGSHTLDVDIESAGPRPKGKGWKKALQEVY